MFSNIVPSIDWTNPLTKDLHRAYYFLENGGYKLHDFVKSAHSTTYAGTPNWVFYAQNNQTNVGGIRMRHGMRFNSGDSESVTIPNASPPSLPASVFIVFCPVSSAGNFTSDSNTTYYGIWSQQTASNEFMVQYGDGAGSTSGNRRGYYASIAYSAGEICTGGARIVSNTNFRLYINGIRDPSPTSSGTGTSYAAGTTSGYIGRLRGAAYSDNAIYTILIWNRALEDIEFNMLHSNPYILLQTAATYGGLFPAGPDGIAKFFGTIMGQGVDSNAYPGITYDEDGNVRASGSVYEGP